MFRTVCLLVAALGAGSASAEDWSGSFAGIQIGRQDAETVVPQTITQTEGLFGLVDTLIGGQDGAADAAVAGIHSGYRMQRGRFVFGGVAELDLTDLEQDFGTTSSFGGTIERGTFEIDQTARLMGQVGVASGATLFYAQAGLSYVDGRVRSTDVDGTGIAIGLGVERKVTERLSVGLDYLREEFDEFDSLDVNNPNGRTLPSQEVSFDSESLRLKLSYQF